MDARGRQAQDHVARGHVPPRQDLIAFDGADRKACEVIVPARIHAGHFRRLAAHQRTAGLKAPLGHALDHGRSDRDIKPAGCKIIEEEQGLCPLHHDVVDRHRHEVDAHRVMDPRFDGDLELGAHAIRAGHQKRILEARRLQVEQAAETAKRRIRARTGRRACQRLDGLDQCVACVNIDAGLRIGQSVLGCAHGGVRLQFPAVYCRTAPGRQAGAPL